MATFSLDNIRDAAEKKFAHTDIEVGDTVVRLVNVLQMSEDKRAALRAAEADTEGISEREALERVIRLVAEDADKAEVLISAVDGNLAMLAEILSTYNGETQAGEA